MEKIIILNVKNAECNYDANLIKELDPDGEHKKSFEFQRSNVSGHFTGGKLGVYFYTIQPGKANFPYHYHTGNEEVFYITSGQGTLRTPEGDKIVSEGDVIVMPANENGAHQLINTSDTPLVYLEVITQTRPDVTILPDSEKLVVFTEKIFAKAFKINSAVNYLTDE